MCQSRELLYPGQRHECRLEKAENSYLVPLARDATSINAFFTLELHGELGAHLLWWPADQYPSSMANPWMCMINVPDLMQQPGVYEP